ncbi:uncharacterized protein LOC144132305 [Amblyomma americanum]
MTTTIPIRTAPLLPSRASRVGGVRRRRPVPRTRAAARLGCVARRCYPLSGDNGRSIAIGPPANVRSCRLIVECIVFPRSWEEASQPSGKCVCVRPLRVGSAHQHVVGR